MNIEIKKECDNSLAITGVRELQEQVLSFLDIDSYLNMRLTCKYFDSFTPIDFIRKVSILGKDLDLYGLFATHLPENLRIPALRHCCEKGFKIAMSASLNNYCFTYLVRDTLIKILGEDNRRSIIKKSQEAFSTDCGFSGTDFKMTPDAVKIFCKIIATPLPHDRIIDTVILSTIKLENRGDPNHPETGLNDEIVKVLMDNLPSGQLKIIKLFGTFGDKGLKEIENNFKRIFSKKINPEKTVFVGTKVSMPYLEEHKKNIQEYIDGNNDGLKIIGHECSIQ